MSEKWIDLTPDSEVIALSDVATSVSKSSTNAQVPSAKCLYDLLGGVESSLETINGSSPEPTSYWGLHFVAEEADVEIGMANVGSPDSVTLEYSVDGGATWPAFTPGTTTVTLENIGDEAWFRAGSAGNTKISKSNNDYRKFTISKKCSCHGNIMSLLDGTDDETATAATMGNFCFRRLFNESKITTAPDLPALTLSINCYDNIFRDCTELTTPMDELPASSIPNYAYQSMFYGCTALTDTPTINATRVDGMYACSHMFHSCSNIRSVKMLCSLYDGNYAFNEMFRDCSKLESVETHVTIWNYTSGAFNVWLDGVSSSGTFYCPSALGTPPDGANPIARGSSRCPTGWTVVNI